MGHLRATMGYLRVLKIAHLKVFWPILFCCFLYLVSLNSLLQQFYRMYFTRNIFRSPEPGSDHQHCVCGPVRHPLRARLLPGGGRLVPRGPQTVPGCQALLRWGEICHCWKNTTINLKWRESQITYISDKLRTASPVHNIHIECFHTETKSAINTFKGNILTK